MSLKCMSSLFFAGIFFLGLHAADNDELNIYKTKLSTHGGQTFSVVMNDAPCFLRIGDKVEEIAKGINRYYEAKYMHIAAEQGLAPQVLGYNLKEGLLLTEFVSNNVLTFDQIRDKKTLSQIVDMMKALHGYPLEDAGEVEQTIMRMCHFYVNNSNVYNISYDRLSMPKWLKAIESFENVHYTNIPKGICHGDINAGNVIQMDDGNLRFINWDYARYGYILDELGALCQNMDDSSINFVLTKYFGTYSPKTLLRLKQNIFMHNFRDYFLFLYKKSSDPKYAEEHQKKANALRDRLNATVRGCYEYS